MTKMLPNKFRIIFASLALIVSASAFSANKLPELLKHEKNGVTKNPVLMMDIYREYSKLKGVKNRIKEVEYLKKAAELGSGEAAFLIYKKMKGSLEITFNEKKLNNPEYWLEQGVKFNYQSAIVEKGFNTLKEKHGDPDELQKSLNKLESLAERYPEIYLKLSELYRNSNDVEQDLDKAKLYAEKYIVANPKSGEGLVESALIELERESADVANVLMNLNKATELGSKKGKKELGILLSKGNIESQEKAYKILNEVFADGDESVKPYINEIKRRNSSPIIYNINLYKAKRKFVRERLLDANVILEKDKGYLDYFGGDNINGASKLMAAYDVGPDGEYLAQLSFIYNNDKLRYAKMYNAISGKYGQPKNLKKINYRKNTSKSGKLLDDSYYWTKGAVKIRITREPRGEGTMKLEYLVYPYVKNMAQKIAVAKRKGAEAGVLKNGSTY